MSRIRQREIKARRMRKLKMEKLRTRYTEAKSATQKEQVLEKLGRITPWLSQEEFVAPLKKKA